MSKSSTALVRAVEVMDRLRSPGGCPWDAEQTHRSLARYLLEETYETLEAIETDDAVLLREELGDLLLQVLFHARIAEELPEGERFSIEDVAADLTDKLTRRHPHVFAPSPAVGLSADDVAVSWDQLKAREKGRVSLTDGIPLAQPALALAGALVGRVERAGLVVAPVPAASDASSGESSGESSEASVESSEESSDDDIGLRLFAVVRDAVAAGIDPETALRETSRAYREAILRAEA